MERRYFKLAQGGYLHVDADALTLTRSGNWQEAASAPERTGTIGPRRIVRIVIGTALVAIAGLTHLHHAGDAVGGGGMVLSVGLIGLGALSMFGRLKDGFAQVFRIPFSKVRSMQHDDGQLTVHFQNGAFKEDRISIPVPEEAAAFVMAHWPPHGRPS